MAAASMAAPVCCSRAGDAVSSPRAAAGAPHLGASFGAVRLPASRAAPRRRCSLAAGRTALGVTAAAVPAFPAGAKLTGVGSAVPKMVLTNEGLSKLVETNDEWIAARTGIRERRILSEGETLTQLAADAARQALDMAGVSAEAVDLILLCTSSPDDAFGGACLLQAAVGARNAVAFDVTAACSGFVVGLVSAAHYVRCGTYRNVLVVGADALSRYVDWRDRGTCILFGDGAGAVLVQGVPGAPCSLLGFDMNSDGTGNKHLTCAYRAAAPGAKPTAPGDAASATAAFANIAMSGQDVFKFAVRSVPATLGASLEKAGMSASQVDWLVMHQANQRILDAVAQRLDLPAERVVSNIARFGNTSAASIPLALDGAVRSGAVRPGQVLATAGFGAGLSWASAIVKWG